MDLDCGGGSLVIFWCWVDFGAELVGRWSFGTLSIFEVFDDFLGVGWILVLGWSVGGCAWSFGTWTGLCRFFGVC